MDFKSATLVYRSLSGMALAYLAADSCRLKKVVICANSRTCIVRWTYSNFGGHSFMAAGPRLWNSLPAGLRQTDIGCEQFKWLLTTYLFGR